MEKVQGLKFTNLTVEIYADANSARYVFLGDIEETFDSKSIPRFAKQTLVFDLAGVNGINSCGVREWVLFMREFSKTTDLSLENCSVSIVDQFNLVPQTMGNAHVTSFYAPYYCANCDEEVTVLLSTREHWDVLTAKAAPEKRHSCGTKLDFDALEDSYFQQIERYPPKKAG
jgi:hypothetical protein